MSNSKLLSDPDKILGGGCVGDLASHLRRVRIFLAVLWYRKHNKFQQLGATWTQRFPLLNVNCSYGC